MSEPPLRPSIYTGVEAFAAPHPRESVRASTTIDGGLRHPREFSPEPLRSSRARDARSLSIRQSHRPDLRPSQLRAKVQPLTLVFKDLTFTVKRRHQGQKDTKVILDHLNGMFKPGRLTAIMGPSGAGKTSLLDCLAGNLLGGQITGQVLVNGDDYTGKKIKEISGFVFQDDVLLETMTVREAIEQSALLRLPKSVDRDERQRRVEDIIELLHLEGCQNTRIGSPEKKGISGGERKRTATAMELLANPPMLFLDEPTSGLDTFTAYTVIRSLNRLARQGRTVIATIHQPSSKIFHLFDDLLLLSEGRIVYYGDAEGSIEYFARLGYRCPRYSNPADYYFMEVLRQFSVRGYRPESIMVNTAERRREEDEDHDDDGSGEEPRISIASSRIDDNSGDKESKISAASGLIDRGETSRAGEESRHHQNDLTRREPVNSERHHEEGNATGERQPAEEESETQPNIFNANQSGQAEGTTPKDSTKDRIEALQQTWLDSSENEKLLYEMENSSREGVGIGMLRKRAPFLTQFKYLLKRASKNAIRNPLIVFLAAFRAIFFGLLVGLLFLDSNQYSSITVQVRNKSGAIFFLALNMFFSSVFGVLTIFYTEKQVFFREYKAGYYGTTAYFFSKFLVELPYAFIFPYLMLIIAYYMVGFNPPFSDYLMMATFVATASICGVAMGVLLASIFSDLQIILAITPAILLPLLLLSGIFVAATSIPGFLVWIRYISPIYYASIGMVQVEFSRPFPNCHQDVCDGELGFQILGIPPPLPMGVNLALAFTIWAVLVLAGYIVLVVVTRLRYTAS